MAAVWHGGITMSAVDNEANILMSDLPSLNSIETFDPGKRLNAYVCIDKMGRLAIFLKGGGWLGVEKEHVQGDLAPFSG